MDTNVQLLISSFVWLTTHN